MGTPRNEFTNVTKLDPEALGEPGHRTFRIMVDGGNSSAVMWLEKEQLFQLALATQQLLGSMEEEGQASPSMAPPDGPEVPTQLEFHVGKLVLGHDGSRGLFMIEAHDSEDETEEDEEGDAAVRVWANREQVKDFAEKALRVCAAGRPLCPLCHRPIDPEGHQCARVNGHVRTEDI